MDKAMVIKAMEGIEKLLAAADQSGDILKGDLTHTNLAGSRALVRDVMHYINNARQIASATKTLMEMDA